VHDRRDRIEERQRVLVREFADRVRQRRRGEGTGRDDHVAPFGGRQPGDFGAVDLDQGMVVQRLGDGRGKAVAVDRQRPTRGHLVDVGAAHDQGAEPAHLGVQQAHSVVGGIVRAERVGADQLGQALGAVCLGHPLRAHLVQDDANARIGDLPGGFRTGEAAANHMDGVSLGSGGNHARRVSAFSRQAHLPWRLSSEVGPVGMQKTRQAEGQTRQRPQQGGRYPFVRRLNGNQLV
jgi:hypothetical protein